MPVSAWCNTNRVQYRTARSTAEGIKVQLSTSDDHRKLTAMLRSQNIPYHTFTLPEERKLRVVIRNVPVELGTDLVKEDLSQQGLPVIEVHRMIRGHTRQPFDLIMVVLDLSKEGKDIFNITTVCGLSGIVVEPPRRNGMLSQCHRCQLYGHSARNCHARPRCVKCLEDHATADCARPKANDAIKSTTPPSCVLCGQVGHPANYRGCPRAPRPVMRRPPPPPPQRYLPAPKPTRNPWVNSQSRAEYPPLPTKLATPPVPAIATPTAKAGTNTNNNLYKPPTVGQKLPPAGLPKPPQGKQVHTHAPATSGLDPDLDLVARFAQIINIAEIRVIAAELRKNEGNSLALLNVAMRFSPVLESLGSFRA